MGDNLENYIDPELNELQLNRIKLIEAIDIGFFSTARKSGLTFSEFKSIENIYSAIKFNINNDYLSFINDKFSFTKKPDNPFIQKNRTQITLGRYARRNLGIDNIALPDGTLDLFTKAILVNIYELNVDDLIYIKGTDITEFYKKTKITSCMTGINSRLTEMYGMNPDKVSLLVYKNKARCLFWICDDGSKYLDRVYPCDTVEASEVIKWAKTNNFHISPKNIVNSYISLKDYDLNDNSLSVCLTLKVDKYIAFMDSFFWVKSFSENKKIITLTTNSDSRHSTDDFYGEDGICYVPWLVKCECCSSYVSKSEIEKISRKYICSKCKINLSKCKYCDSLFFLVEPLDYTEPGISNVCETCYHKLYNKCAYCYKNFLKTDMKNISSKTYYCDYCIKYNMLKHRAKKK